MVGPLIRLRGFVQSCTYCDAWCCASTYHQISSARERAPLAVIRCFGAFVSLLTGWMLQGDMTMALDLDLRHFQTMWPWLAEMSILTAVLSIFVPAERGRRAAVMPRIQPWFYINIVLEHFQALLPITRDLLDVDAAVAQVLCLPTFFRKSYQIETVSASLAVFVIATV